MSNFKTGEKDGFENVCGFMLLHAIYRGLDKVVEAGTAMQLPVMQ